MHNTVSRHETRPCATKCEQCEKGGKVCIEEVREEKGERSFVKTAMHFLCFSSRSLVPRPLPPEERPGTHCLRMREISVKSFVKICTLPCPYLAKFKNTQLS